MRKTLFLVMLSICLCLLGCNNTKIEEVCQHTWGEWQYNDESHWRDYTCGHDSPEVAGEHTWSDGVEVESVNGGYVMEYTCTVCGKKHQEIIVIIPSTPVVNNNLLFTIEDKTKELVKQKNIILTNIKSSILVSSITSLFDDCIEDIRNAETIYDVNELADNCLKDVYKLIPLANGKFNYSNLSDFEKKEILSLLDDYIFRNNLGGIPISKNYTLNLNSTTKEDWIKFFGEEGSICQTPKNEYWDVKPFLSNENFLKGLCLALPKEETSNESSIFQEIDYSQYEFYNYDLELARKYFTIAANELALIYGSSSQYPIELKLEIAFGTKTNENEQLFNALKESIENAFNDQSVSNGSFVLTVEAWYGEYFGQIYTEKLYNGQFDLSYDKISGSSYDKYMYYKLLSSNPDLSNKLTINWSINTNNIEADCVVYNGYRFTYDALLALLNSNYTIIDGSLPKYADIYTLLDIPYLSVEEIVEVRYEQSAIGVAPGGFYNISYSNNIEDKNNILSLLDMLVYEDESEDWHVPGGGYVYYSIITSEKSYDIIITNGYISVNKKHYKFEGTYPLLEHPNLEAYAFITYLDTYEAYTMDGIKIGNFEGLDEIEFIEYPYETIPENENIGYIETEFGRLYIISEDIFYIKDGNEYTFFLVIGEKNFSDIF